MPVNYNARLLARGYVARDRGMTTPATGRTSTPSPETRCAPPCADCGRLACACRPRFFAGQLLTEQDLNRLDAYIRGKNKLHTLQLHGWGVVNGLDVRCGPCGAGVVVGKGYAISPCGDDIVVCEDTAVPVCDLIQKCVPVDRTCQPYQGIEPGDCDAAIEDWVLAIRYAETPARGVTALRFGASCSCGAAAGSCSCGAATTGRSGARSCGCAGSAGTGCGCGAKATAATTTTAGTRATPRGASPECEPTVICEGYAWDMFLAPQPKTKAPTLGGPLIDRMMCCIQPLIEAIPVPPNPLPAQPTPEDFNQQPAAWNLWCCQTKAAFIAFLSSGPQSNCALLELVMSWSCPAADSDTFGDDMVAAWAVLVRLLLDAMIACECAALLPPAPCGTTDDRIPLAIVRVRKKDCKVMEVCNFTPLRKTVCSFVTLDYWLSWIPLNSMVMDALHRVCCRTLSTDLPGFVAADASHVAVNPGDAASAAAAQPRRARLGTVFSQPREYAVLRVNPTLSPKVAADGRTFTALLSDAMARGATPLDPAAVVGGVFKLGGGAAQKLSPVELANAPQFLLLNQVLRPIAAHLFNPPALNLLRGLFATDAAVAAAQPAPAASSAAGETEALKARITVLEEAIKRMQAPGDNP